MRNLYKTSLSNESFPFLLVLIIELVRGIDGLNILIKGIQLPLKLTRKLIRNEGAIRIPSK